MKGTYFASLLFPLVRLHVLLTLLRTSEREKGERIAGNCPSQAAGCICLCPLSPLSFQAWMAFKLPQMSSTRRQINLIKPSFCSAGDGSTEASTWMAGGGRHWDAFAYAVHSPFLQWPNPICRISHFNKLFAQHPPPRPSVPIIASNDAESWVLTWIAPASSGSGQCQGQSLVAWQRDTRIRRDWAAN